MAVLLPTADKDGSRKRRVHRKSRRGCGNCKLRRVKCDESHPSCKKCVSYGVSCNYDPGPASEDLQLSADGAFQMQMVERLPCSLNKTILSMINATLSESNTPFPDLYTPYQLGEMDYETLHRFQTRTIWTLGTRGTAGVYQRWTLPLAAGHPFLMHMIIALTLMHDRYLSHPHSPRWTTAEVFHWYKGIAMFNLTLSKPIRRSSKDALWTAAAMLGAIAFCCIEAASPEEAWPLKPASPLDLDWLRMSDGKKAIWEIADMSRPESVFQALNPNGKSWLRTLGLVPTELQREKLPTEMVTLCGLDDPGATPESNPYYKAACILSNVIDLTLDQDNVVQFLSFTGHMDPLYKGLLACKDPRALLLLVWWYAKVSKTLCQWWIQRRAELEGRAICIYLEKFVWRDERMRSLLAFPRRECGLDDKEDGKFREQDRIMLTAFL